MSDKTKTIVSAAMAYNSAKADLLAVIQTLTVEEICLFDPTDSADQLICMITEMQTAAKDFLSLVC